MHHPPGRNYGLSTLAAALLAAFAVPALASEPVELEVVTVSATRAGTVAGETSQKITVIGREEIECQLAMTSDQAQVLGNLIPSYSPSRQKLDYRVEAKQGNWDFVAGATYQTRGLFYDAQGTPIGVDNTQGDIMDSVSHDFLFKLGNWFDDNQRLTFTLNHFLLEGNNDYVSVTGNAAAGIPTTSRKGSPGGKAPQNDTLTSSLAYTHGNLGGNELDLQLYSQRFRARFGGGTLVTFQDASIAPAGTLFDQSQNESDKLGAKMTLKRDRLFDNRLMLTGGVDMLQDTTRQMLFATDRQWVPETRFRNVAPFVQTEASPTTASSGCA